MQDEKGKIESELTEFFAGLDAGLKSLRKVRSIYDEQVAFEFNVTSFFWPDENKTSEILAFFLNPKESHGQKTTFLKLFVKQFKLQKLPPDLLEDIGSIEVACEDPTAEKRRIDITIQFGNDKYIIGIENKIGTAPDQPNQIHDYVKELRGRTKGDDKRWTLFYLTPNGDNPSTVSITEEFRKELITNENQNLRNINYREEIIGLLEQFEMSCKAENVRAFLKDFRQYLKKKHIGETFMGENNFVTDYLRDHPNILKHADALRDAVESTKKECFNTFWIKVAEYLKKQSIIINPTAMFFFSWGNLEALVEHHNSPFGPSGELTKVIIFYNQKIDPPFYIAINLSIERNELPPQLKSKVDRLEEKLKKMQFGEVRGNVGLWWWCGAVPLPHINFNDGDELCKILNDKDGSIMQNRAIEAAEKITKYINVTESLWREVSIAEPKSPASPA